MNSASPVVGSMSHFCCLVFVDTIVPKLKKAHQLLLKFNYNPSLKKAHQSLLKSYGIFIVESDLNDAKRLAKLFDVVAFMHVMHLATQAGVRYTMENPQSYVHRNIVDLVTLLRVHKSANPQLAIVWASSSFVFGLNKKVSFFELVERCKRY